MDLESDEEDFDAMKRPKYSTLLSEEEYEDEDGPESYEHSPLQDNFEDPDPSPEIQGWDPREAHDFFRIQ
jgi:hypothetical protein